MSTAHRNTTPFSLAHTQTYTLLSWPCPDCSWTVFHSNKHLGKQKHTSCRKKKPFTWECAHLSLSLGQTFTVFSTVVSLQAFHPFPIPGSHCSLADALSEPHCPPKTGVVTAEFLLSYRISGHHIFALVFNVSFDHWPFGLCCFAFYNNTVNVTLFVQKDKVPIQCTEYEQNAWSFPICCLRPVAVPSVWKSQLLLRFCVLSSFSLDNFSSLLQKEIWNKYKAHST